MRANTSASMPARASALRTRAARRSWSSTTAMRFMRSAVSGGDRRQRSEAVVAHRERVVHAQLHLRALAVARGIAQQLGGEVAEVRAQASNRAGPQAALALVHAVEDGRIAAFVARE